MDYENSLDEEMYNESDDLFTKTTEEKLEQVKVWMKLKGVKPDDNSDLLVNTEFVKLILGCSEGDDYE